MNLYFYAIIFRSSSGYGENTKPAIGFSLLQPQNDPKKCLYLLVAHSSVVETSGRLRFSNGSKASPISSPTSENDSFKSAEESGLDELSQDESFTPETQNIPATSVKDDDPTEPGFVLLYRISFERCVNIFLNQNELYLLYEVNFINYLAFLKITYLNDI